jgi:hypothetical protein
VIEDDDPPEDEELAQAQRLAEALERAPDQRVPDAGVADAVDTADLIMASRLPELGPARAEAVLREVHARIDGERTRRRNRRIALAAVMTSTLAAAATVLLLLRPQDGTQEPAAVASAPPARGIDARSAAVDAQRAWLADPSADNRSALTARLADFRAAHFAELDRRLAP